MSINSDRLRRIVREVVSKPTKAQRQYIVTKYGKAREFLDLAYWALPVGLLETSPEINELMKVAGKAIVDADRIVEKLEKLALAAHDEGYAAATVGEPDFSHDAVADY